MAGGGAAVRGHWLRFRAGCGVPHHPPPSTRLFLWPVRGYHVHCPYQFRSMTAPGVVLTDRILAKYGSQPDLRLYRNATTKAYVGRLLKGSKPGTVVTIVPGRPIEAGLCEGSADLIGIGPGGRFWALEVKAGKDRLSDLQRGFLRVMRELGGIGEEVRSVAQVGEILAQERERVR